MRLPPKELRALSFGALLRQYGSLGSGLLPLLAATLTSGCPRSIAFDYHTAYFAPVTENSSHFVGNPAGICTYATMDMWSAYLVRKGPLLSVAKNSSGEVIATSSYPFTHYARDQLAASESVAGWSLTLWDIATWSPSVVGPTIRTQVFEVDDLPEQQGFSREIEENLRGLNLEMPVIATMSSGQGLVFQVVPQPTEVTTLGDNPNIPTGRDSDVVHSVLVTAHAYDKNLYGPAALPPSIEVLDPNHLDGFGNPKLVDNEGYMYSYGVKPDKWFPWVSVRENSGSLEAIATIMAPKHGRSLRRQDTEVYTQANGVQPVRVAQ